MAENRSILVIEDDPHLAQALRDSLVQSGFTVVTATRFSEALQKTSNQRFLCILTDLQLETGSGLKVIQSLRNETSKGLNFDTPVILMSGHLEPEVIKAAAGKVQAILAKPFDVNAIITKIHEITDSKVES